MALTEPIDVDVAPTPAAAVRRPAVGLPTVVARTRPVALAREALLPVAPAFEALLPDAGLRRGTTVAVGGGPGATSLALALGAASSAAGSWAGVVGLPSLGLEAAGELGVALERLLLVDPPPDRWATVVAALLDAVDLVHVALPPRVRLGDARRLAARARERGAVLVVHASGSSQAGAWPEAPEVRLTVAGVTWEGPVGDGAGRLTARRVEVVGGGRGAAARPRRAALWLPDATGAVRAAEPRAARRRGGVMTTRTLVVWCPDWPVVASGAGPDDAVAVVFANRVVACSAAARAEGVRRGLRRREAQGRCPDLALVAADPDRDARAFEPVAAAVATLSPRLEVLRPGTLALATRGPSRYFGGDEALAARAAALGTEALDGSGSARAGVADGPFAALMAARAPGTGPTVVPPGGSAAFLAPLPVGDLELALDADGGTAGRELAELLHRLGLRTLGAVAALPAGAVLGRFGVLGARAACLARGEDERPPDPRPPEPDLVVAIELDPPAERVETAAFAARTLAAELGERLARRGMACTAVAVEAETEHGEALSRRWRSEGGLSPAALADRVRWQLDGWLHGSAAVRPTGGISLLRLVPDAVVPDEGRQLGFWGGATDADERAARGVARLQGLLGPDAVTVPQLVGGRSPAERGRRVPAHVVRLGAPAVAPSRAPAAGPWPGALPPPSPAVASACPVAAAVLDGDGRSVGVTGRGLVTAAPERVAVGGGPPSPVVAWAGPWPVDERWWDPGTARRRARLQVVLPGGEAHLLGLEGGRWTLEGTYD